jgi:ABC-type transporter MlaC component
MASAAENTSPRTEILAVANHIATESGGSGAATVRAVLALLDTESVAERILGVHARQLSPAQHRKFLGLLYGYVVAETKSRLLVVPPFSITCGEEVVEPHARVTCTVSTRAQDYEVVFLMEHGNAWRVTDIHIDGLYMVRDNAHQIDRVIRRHGFSGLVDKMQRRVASPMGQAGPRAH